MSFKTASKKAQLKATRPLLREFGFPNEELSDVEYEERLRDLVRKMESRIVNFRKDSKERKHLGVQKFRVQEELKRISPKNKPKVKSLAHCFVDVCRKNMKKADFEFYRELALEFQNEIVFKSSKRLLHSSEHKKDDLESWGEDV